MMRVLKPTGSIFVDLGDKYGRPGGGADVSERTLNGAGRGATQRLATPAGVDGVREKSLMLLPERYRVGCVDRLGLIARAVIVWNKPNGLPESVTDRVRRSHEDWVHLVRQPKYYSATDEVRESYSQAPDAIHHRRNGIAQTTGHPSGDHNSSLRGRDGRRDPYENPLGKLPGSVWTIPSEPLDLPGYFVTQDGTLVDFIAPTRGRPRPNPNGNGHGLFDPDTYAELIAGEDAGAWRWIRSTGINASPWPKTDDGLQLHTAASHYAAFPSEWPRRLIKGFSPPGICLDCGQGRVPVVDRRYETIWNHHSDRWADTDDNNHDATKKPHGMARTEATILGYACSCTPFTDHPATGERTRRDHNINGGLPPGEKWTHDAFSAKPKVGPWREYHLQGWTPPPTRPAVILDPFSGTGTTPMVARALGRIGIGVDLSRPYCRAARWRVQNDGGKAISRTNLERQGQLL
jgi:hypothetical protein